MPQRTGRKYGRLDEILRDILNGKPKIVQNRTKSECDTEDEDDDYEEDMPEETPNRTYDTSKWMAITNRHGQLTSPEEVIQIGTDGEIPQVENIENEIRRLSRNTNRPNRYGIVPCTATF